MLSVLNSNMGLYRSPLCRLIRKAIAPLAVKTSFVDDGAALTPLFTLGMRIVKKKAFEKKARFRLVPTYASMT